MSSLTRISGKNLRKIGIKMKSNECNFDPQTMINLFSNPNTENNLISSQLKPDLIFDGNKLNLISRSLKFTIQLYPYNLMLLAMIAFT